MSEPTFEEMKTIIRKSLEEELPEVSAERLDIAADELAILVQSAYDPDNPPLALLELRRKLST